MAGSSDDLYALPPAEFTAARNALAADLKKRGSRDEASRVASLRKPSLAAWALNRLARVARDQLDALFDAGEAMRAAHTAILGGGDPAQMQAARAAHRAQVAALVERAAGALSDDGHAASATTLDRVRAALEASVDGSVQAALLSGTMAVEPSGGGDLLGGVEPGPVRAGGPAPPPAGPSERQRRRIERLEQDLASARDELKQAQAGAVAATERSRRAAARALEANRDADEAARDLERAERALARAQQAAAKAQTLLAGALGTEKG